MKLKNKCLVMYVKPYKFEDNGRTTEGLTVYYLDTDSLANSVNDDGSKGTKPLKANLPADKVTNFSAVPAIYDMTFETAVNANLQSVVKLRDAVFVSGCSLAPAQKA